MPLELVTGVAEVVIFCLVFMPASHFFPQSWCAPASAIGTNKTVQASLDKRFFEEIAIGVGASLCLSFQRFQKVDRVSTILFPLVVHLRQPVLAVVCTAEFGFIALFNAIDVLPCVNFLSDGVRAKNNLYVFGFQLIDVAMLQGEMNIDGLRYSGEWIEGLAPTGRVVCGVLAELIAAVAFMAGRREIPKVDGVKRV